MLKNTRVFLISLLNLLHCVTCNDIEEHLQERISYVSEKMGSCGEYFKYQRIDEFINGKLELPNIKMGDTVKMTFYKIEFINQPFQRFNGILLPDENPQTVINKIRNGQVISYRVDFPILRTVPALNKIFVNGNILCTTKHNSSNEIFVLRHTMQIVNGSLSVFTHNINIPNFIENPSLKNPPVQSLSVENPTCGLIDDGIGLTPLIYGGSEIVRGEYPWLAAIYKKQENVLTFLCGGSLVTARFILTAAHCFQGSNLNADKIVATLGQHNLSNYLEDDYLEIEIEELILNPEYKYQIGFSDADLAVLKMEKIISFSKFIKPICLWFGPADESLVANSTCVVVGWGSDENGNTISEVPKKVKVNIVPENICLRSSLAYTALTSLRTLCAGNRDGSGPCEGDSGGGLMIKKYGRWMLRGVVSAGLTKQKRCNLHEYTVYCDVARHKKWLQEYVGKEKLISGSIEKICGISGTDLRSEHPWLAAIYKKTYAGLQFSYTGSLISSRTVLTRASNFVNLANKGISPFAYRIFLGRYDLNNIKEDDVMTREVASIIFHPDFNKLGDSLLQENGIALVRMKSPVGFTEHVKPSCLWNEPNDGQSDIVDQSVTLSSWHRPGVFDESFTVPTSIKINITSIEQCQTWGYDESMSSRILCVHRLEDKNGAIMMFSRNGRWFLRGINALKADYSFHMSKEYFVFHDLAKYLTWIQKNMS